MLIAQLKNKVGYLVIINCIQFIVLTIIAMFTYAGGTFYNPGTRGESFFNNFFSELGGLKNHEGDSNIISAIFLYFLSLSWVYQSFPFF
ncbi:MAG: hypothetical protein GF317_22145 [Candidatus Lokiarchaeota archaeon]|nr:hypothetical protein [Candidatus Lokiarchaeota archaeon]MBD3202162.1 hypothetical protein [Candidatus Lokiarchaeota archaeon]